MSRCDFNKLQSKSHLDTMFSCKFAAYIQNTFSKEHLWVAASYITQQLEMFPWLMTECLSLVFTSCSNIILSAIH